MSVAGVHQEVSKQTHAVNKSEVYSHYLGLLFRRILALMAHQGWWWRGGEGLQRPNRDEQSEDAVKNKGKFRKKHVAHRESNWPLKSGVNQRAASGRTLQVSLAAILVSILALALTVNQVNNSL